MPLIVLAGFLVCRSLDEADRVSELLPDRLRAVRDEPGCLRFEMLRSMADPARFAVFRTFRDRPAFEAHQARTLASAWWQATRHIPRDYRVEEVPDPSLPGRWGA